MSGLRIHEDSGPLSEAETITLLVDLFAGREPFVHVRFGDGDVFFATGTGPKVTADGEEWTPRLADELRHAWQALALYDGLLLLGDLRSYVVSDGCEAQWDRMLRSLLNARNLRRVREPDIAFGLVHIEALRVGFGYAIPFYQAVRDDPRRKLYIGPSRHAPVARALRCDLLPVPLAHAHVFAHVIATLIQGLDPEVCIFAAGRGGKIVQGILASESPGIVQVDVGSGLDLLLEDGVRRGTDAGAVRSRILAQYAQAGLRPR